MCSFPEFIASLAFVGMFACMALGVVHESRFVGHVEMHHPALWHELAQRSKWRMPEDGNYSHAGVQWHLILRGGYKNIDDPRARELGRNARLVSAGAVSCLLIVGLYATMTQNFPPLRCLVSWL